MTGATPVVFAQSVIRSTYKKVLPEEARVRIRRRFDDVFCGRFEDKLTLGGRCRWTILTRGLDAGSIVYSGGVGEDISFELALVDRFGCEIQIFDPSPAGQATIRRTGPQAEKLRFKALGLAGSSTPMRFQSKEWENDIFFYKQPDQTGKPFHEVTVPCTTIAQELAANGHARIDLLKIDIEGFEYDVLESCLQRSIFPRQICVEFHHFFPGGSKLATARAVWKLRRAGYRLVHKSYYDLTFYHRDYL